MGIIGTPGNGLLFLVQLRTKISTDYLVATMAALDLVDASVVTVFRMSNLLIKLHTKVLYIGYCRLYFLIFFATSFVSGTSLGLLLWIDISLPAIH